MSETAKLADVLGAEVVGRIMAEASAKMAELEKDETFSKLTVEQRASKQDEVVSRMVNNYLDRQRTFVHYDRPGYWADKLIGGVVTVGVAVVVGAVAMKVAGKPAEAVLGETGEQGAETQPPLFDTGFNKASDRPIRSSRELKAAV